MNNQTMSSKGVGPQDFTANMESLSPLVLRARIAFKWMAWLFTILILIQVFLAGLALFWNSAHWSSHTGFSRVLIILPLLMLVTSFVARFPSSLRLHSAGLIGMIVLIAVSANLSSEVGYLSALHPVFALVLFWGTISLARKAQAFVKAK